MRRNGILPDSQAGNIKTQGIASKYPEITVSKRNPFQRAIGTSHISGSSPPSGKPFNTSKSSLNSVNTTNPAM